MTKQFLYKDESGINSNLGYIETAINTIKPFFERFQALNLQTTTPINLNDFIGNPKAFFVNILADGETLKIGQMELEPEKIYELFPVSEDIKQLVTDLLSFNRQSNFTGNNGYSLQHIIVSQNELSISEAYVNDVTDRHTFYTETEEQNQALELLQKITVDLNTLHNLGKKPFRYFDKLIQTCFKEKTIDNEIVMTENIKVVRNF